MVAPRGGTAPDRSPSMWFFLGICLVRPNGTELPLLCGTLSPDREAHGNRLQPEGANVWSSVKKLIKYILGCLLCLIGLIVGLSGQLTVSKNGGSAHPDKLLQYLIGGAFFLVGVLFIVSARRSAKRSGPGRAQPRGPISGTAPSRNDIDRQIARKMAEDSQRQLDNLGREAEQRRIWGDQ